MNEEDDCMKEDWTNRMQAAQEVVEATIKSLPARLRSAASTLPITFEDRPSDAQVSDGIEPDTLGLFVGESYPELLEDGPDIPGQMILYLDNIWDFVEGDEEAYREEIRTTLLHELGHYLGLDETDLEARGLE